MRYHHKFMLGMFAFLTAIGSAWAQQYPDRPIKWIVPYPPAGTTDVLARIVAQPLSEILGQQVIVENRPGAGNNIGTEAVIKAAPDGYTMLLVNPANGINATLYKNLPFNFIRDIAPVAGIVRTPNVMVVPANFPANNVAEFLAYCKNNVSKINMASSGSGTSVHMSGELFKSMTGCNMLHVPYKGAGPAVASLLAGETQVMFSTPPAVMAQIKAGKLIALSYSDTRRHAQMPEVPTATEAGLGSFTHHGGWFGMFAPANTPLVVLNRLHQEVRTAFANPQFRERLEILGADPVGNSPADFKIFVGTEIKRYVEMIRLAKIQPE